jgi:excisionase family DNA binding protein
MFRSDEDPDQLMDIKEASAFIRLSVPTVYGLVHQSAIPVSKRGKRLYFSKRELLAWVQVGRRKTLEEIKAEADNYIKRRPWPHKH